MFGYDSLFKAIYDALGSDSNLSALKTNTDNIETRLSNVESDLTTSKIHTPWMELANVGTFITGSWVGTTINNNSDGALQDTYTVPSGHVLYVKSINFSSTAYSTLSFIVTIGGVDHRIMLGGTSGILPLDGLIKIPAGGYMNLSLSNHSGSAISAMGNYLAVLVAE